MNHHFITDEEMRSIFAANLRFLRKSKDWPISQKTLARLIHVPRKTIINYESGSASLSACVIYRIAVYFHIPMEELLTKKLYEERKNEF